MSENQLPVHSPSDVIYRRVFAPVDVGAMLESAEMRGRIRRLPVPQLFYGLSELETAQIQQLLPHLTEEQWTGILDLSLWVRDQLECGEFLRWQQEIIAAQDAVARKLLRATDDDLWEALFKGELEIHPLVEEDPAQIGEGREWLETPDHQFVLGLPENAEKARLLRSLILRLYDLDSEGTRDLLLSTLARTSGELEESAYQSRRRRVEDLGFQDYFDAIEVYTYLPEDERLPRKEAVAVREVSTLPAPTLKGSPGEMLLLEALARIESGAGSQAAMEELFFVCNKVLVADSVSASRPGQVKEVIGKALGTMNLGLECWSKGDLEEARRGVEEHYLQSFFQLGYSRLLDLQERVTRVRDAPQQPARGSIFDRVLEALSESFPRLARQEGERVTLRFLETREDLKAAARILDEIERGQAGGVQ